MSPYYWIVLLFISQAQVASANPNSIQWISPTPGEALLGGQSVEAKWYVFLSHRPLTVSGEETKKLTNRFRTSDQAIRDPTFSLCTADARCGQASPAKVISNDDGSSSALL